MFISIVIPIWNDEKYLEECLDSCLDQDLPSDDFEIICVDDGSTDRTPEILRDYAQRCPNVRLIFNKHQGGTKGRNNGMEQAKGDYIWFVDHDDLIGRNVLSELKQVCGEETEEPYDRLLFPVFHFRSALSETQKQQRSDGTLAANGAMFKDAIWASILRRDFLFENDIWPRSKKIPPDQPLWFADGFFISECIRAFPKQRELTDRPFYFYRSSATQQTADQSEKTLRRKIIGMANVALSVKQDYDAERAKDGAAQEITANQLMQWIRTATTNIAPMRRKLYRFGIREMKQKGLFPFAIPPECTYTWRDCVKNNKRNGQGPVSSFLYYFSSTSWGMRLYRMTYFRVFLGRLRKKLSGRA